MKFRVFRPYSLVLISNFFNKYLMNINQRIFNISAHLVEERLKMAPKSGRGKQRGDKKKKEEKGINLFFYLNLI